MRICRIAKHKRSNNESRLSILTALAENTTNSAFINSTRFWRIEYL
jgi:hypothetical protein